MWNKIIDFLLKGSYQKNVIDKEEKRMIVSIGKVVRVGEVLILGGINKLNEFVKQNLN